MPHCQFLFDSSMFVVHAICQARQHNASLRFCIWVNLQEQGLDSSMPCTATQRHLVLCMQCSRQSDIDKDKHSTENSSLCHGHAMLQKPNSMLKASALPGLQST